MKTYYIACFFASILFFSCKKNDNKSEIICIDSSCVGTYIGPEFYLGDDIAHQFSNKICKSVGDKLKELYRKGDFSKVNFSKILMSTEGMGTGNVIYKIIIPFSKVKEKCEAYTSFDHVGGWNHEPALRGRKVQLKKALLKGETLYISNLMRTEEGLQEYWIQWKNKEIQSDCVIDGQVVKSTIAKN
jgi:hypothetical protein